MMRDTSKHYVLSVLFICLLGLTASGQDIYLFRPNRMGGAALNVKISVNGLDFYTLPEKGGLKLEDYHRGSIDLKMELQMFSGMSSLHGRESFELDPTSDLYIEVSSSISSVNARRSSPPDPRKIAFSTWKYEEFEKNFQPRVVNQVVNDPQFEDEVPEQAVGSSDDAVVRVRVSEDLPEIDKVAVIGKASELCDGTNDTGEGLAELIAGELLGIYGIVERNHLDEVLNEQRLAMGGLVFEDSDFAKAGCLAGAQGTVICSYGCLQGQTRILVKLVDCSTAEMYWSATGLGVSEFRLLDELRYKLRNR